VNITHNQGDPLTGTAAGNNVVGGTTPAARNVISGNDFGGVVIIHDTDNNKVVGNYIGTDVSGTLDHGNANYGVEIFNSSNNVVGGMTAGAGNRISGNSGPGVVIDTPGTSSPGYPAADNHVLSNSISANDGPGVLISNHPTNLNAVGNSILRNSIFDNGGLGIDLDGGTQSTEGVTRIDTGDADNGPNRLQNYPVITSAITSGSQTTIQGTLNTTANDRLTLQFFSSPAADPSDWGEGKTYIGETTVDTDPQGNKDFNFTPSTPLAAGQVVTATATSTFTSDTSEFSLARKVVNTAPAITNLKPAPDSEIRDRTPLITATVRDAQTNLAKSNIKLFVDGESNTTFSYDRSTDKLSYTSGQLSFGRHTVKIVATDGLLSATKSWSFKVVRG
jgi:titin